MNAAKLREFIMTLETLTEQGAIDQKIDLKIEEFLVESRLAEYLPPKERGWIKTTYTEGALTCLRDILLDILGETIEEVRDNAIVNMLVAGDEKFRERVSKHFPELVKEKEDASLVIKCFGHLTLIRLPHLNQGEPSDKITATVTLGGHPGLGHLFIRDGDFGLNQLFDVEIRLTPISEEERVRIAESQPVLI